MARLFSRSGRAESLAQAIQNLQDIPPGAPEKVSEAWEVMREHAQKSDRATVEAGMRQLVSGLPRREPGGNWPSIYALGILVEINGNPRIAGAAVLAQCKPIFAHSSAHYRALNAAWDQAEASAGRKLSEAEMDAIERSVQRQRGAASMMGDHEVHFIFYARALLAYLSRDKELRKAARGDATFVQDVAMFRQFPDEIGWLTIVLEMLDDEKMLVLYPLHRKGFVVQISGITHNFQLHTLLADKIMGVHIPGQRPDPRVVAASRDKPWSLVTPIARGSFHLHDWTAIEPDGRVIGSQPDGSVSANSFERMIWHEGRPQDIPAFEGKRVIILAPLAHERTWRAPRDLEGENLVGELEVVSVLTPQQVEACLRRLAAAPKPPGNQAPT